MEIQIPYSIIFTFFCLLLVIHKLSSSYKPTKTLPPGPWKLPLIGNLHQFVGSLPHRSLRILANKYGPFMHLQLGQVSHIIVSSPEYAKEIMKTHDQNFANRPFILASEILFYNSTDIAFSPYGSYWRQLRKICTLELFSAKRVQSFRRIREEEVSLLVRSISEHEGYSFNLTPKIFELTNSIAARTVFGKKTKNVEQMIQILEELVKLCSGLSIIDLYPSLKFISTINGLRARIMKVHRSRDKAFDDIIRDHEEKKKNNAQEEGEDLVDVLLRIQKDNNEFDTPLSLDNIKAVLSDVFFAGTETTATTAEWAMSELLKNPKAMKEAQEEVRRVYGDKEYIDESELHQLKYITAVIKETLRLHVPLALSAPRENNESCEINGYVIPPKTKVIINAWAIARDPKYWHDPEKFEPKRFLDATIDHNGTNFEYIPFGAGRRICPGITFSTPILVLLLSNLLYHFNWKLPKETSLEEFDMETFGVTVRRKNDLSLVPICYSP